MRTMAIGRRWMMTGGTTTSAGVQRHPCPTCDTNGVVDFIDLVRGRATMHCPACPTSWAECTEAPMNYLRTHT